METTTLNRNEYEAVLQRIGTQIAAEWTQTLERLVPASTWVAATRERCARDMAQRGYTFLEGRRVRVPYDREQAPLTEAHDGLTNAQHWGLWLTEAHGGLTQDAAEVIKMEIVKQPIFNVSITMSPADDKGFCVSFLDERQARDCAADAKRDGAFSVFVWVA